MNQEKYFAEMIKNARDTKEKLFFAGIFLFAKEGYSNVGIRKLCGYVNIKESSFYNHFKSKSELLSTILKYYKEQNDMIPFTQKEIEDVIEKEDIEYFFRYNMDKFGLITNSPLYYTVLQIILRERFLREDVYEAEMNSLYYLRKDYTEKIFEGLKKRGVIKDIDVSLITQEYYYGLKGLLDEYVLRAIWDSDLEEVSNKINSHIMFFIKYLKKG